VDRISEEQAQGGGMQTERWPVEIGRALHGAEAGPPVLSVTQGQLVLRGGATAQVPQGNAVKDRPAAGPNSAGALPLGIQADGFSTRASGFLALASYSSPRLRVAGRGPGSPGSPRPVGRAPGGVLPALPLSTLIRWAPPLSTSGALVNQCWGLPPEPCTPAISTGNLLHPSARLALGDRSTALLPGARPPPFPARCLRDGSFGELLVDGQRPVPVAACVRLGAVARGDGSGGLNSRARSTLGDR